MMVKEQSAKAAQKFKTMYSCPQLATFSIEEEMSSLIDTKDVSILFP